MQGLCGALPNGTNVLCLDTSSTGLGTLLLCARQPTHAMLHGLTHTGTPPNRTPLHSPTPQRPAHCAASFRPRRLRLRHPQCVVSSARLFANERYADGWRVPTRERHGRHRPGVVEGKQRTTEKEDSPGHQAVYVVAALDPCALEDAWIHGASKRVRPCAARSTGLGAAAVNGGRQRHPAGLLDRQQPLRRLARRHMR